MPKETDEDSRIARLLGECAPEQVTQAREAWQRNKIMRAVMEEGMKKQIEERRNRLETISEADLKSVQGEIKGIRTALGIALPTTK